MWDSIVAAAAALAGTGLAFGLQQVAAARTDREARAREQATEIRTCVRELAAALTNHRRSQFERWVCERDGLDADEQTAARRQSWSTRSVVTDAVAALRLATADETLLAAAEEAVDAAYNLKHPADQADMDVRADRARAAHNTLLAEAARYTTA